MLVSVSGDGTQGRWSSASPVLSAEGRFVAFLSLSDNLVTNDDNGVEDLFVHDRVEGDTVRVNTANDGAEANAFPETPRISADGRIVAFGRSAVTFVAGEPPKVSQDVFTHDLTTGKTRHVNAGGAIVASAVTISPSLSSDGRFVTFVSSADNFVPGDTNGDPTNASSGYDVFLRDRVTGATSRVNVASDGAEAKGGVLDLGLFANPVVSDDGRLVAFLSDADNLVPGDSNGVPDAFVHDTVTGETTRVSVGSGGEQLGVARSVTLSADGRYIAFGADPVLFPGTAPSAIFLRNLVTGTVWSSVSVPTGRRVWSFLRSRPIFLTAGSSPSRVLPRTSFPMIQTAPWTASYAIAVPARRYGETSASVLARTVAG